MFSALQLVGGVALFLFGVRMLSTGMEKLAGDRIQEWLDRIAGKPVRGAAIGAAATALIQSSSRLMVTMIGLINANLMTLQQAVGVMMGQEIGTTLTAQIVAFRIGHLYYLFVALGVLLIELTLRRRWRMYGEIILGFGVLFLGMDLMSGALDVLAEMPAVAMWLSAIEQNPLFGILLGTILTAAVQSSSAVAGLVVAMGISEVITLPGAIAVLFGANIGTCVTGWIASVRLSPAARQASVAQIGINVIGVLLFLPFLAPFAGLVGRTSTLLPRQIANAHTAFNLIVSLILLPFVRAIARAAERLVPEKQEAGEPKVTAYIDERQYRLPAVALNAAYRELDRIGEATVQMIERSRMALVEGDMDAARWVLEQQSEFVEPVCEVLEDFVNVLMQGNLSVRQQRRCLRLKDLVADIERVGSLAENLAQAAQKKAAHHVVFSPLATSELDRLCRHTHRTYALSLQALQDGDRQLAQRTCQLEDEFDKLYLEAREGHIDRLSAGICQSEADVLFVESLRNLEHVSDHAGDLGISVMQH